MKYLGIHTSLGHLYQEGNEKIPFLKENKGSLPPFLIAVGDRRRVRDAETELGLKDAVRIHVEAKELLGHKASGRVDMVVGLFEHKGKAIPLAVFETQMGGPPLEIITREVFTHTKTGEYRYKGKRVAKSDTVYVIRAGSAGGINDPEDPKATVVKVGDIVNGTHSIGYSGALIHSLGGNNYFHPGTQSRFWSGWKRLGGEKTGGDQFPLIRSDKRVVQAISSAAKELHVRFHEGGNFSKDSLYAESKEEDFIDLRRRYGVMGTEMEQVTMAANARRFEPEKKILTGLVSGIVGTVPGGSFASSEEEKEAAASVEGNVLRVSALALWKLAH